MALSEGKLQMSHKSVSATREASWENDYFD